MPFGKSIFFQIFSYKLHIFNLEENKIVSNTASDGSISKIEKCSDFFGLEIKEEKNSVSPEEIPNEKNRKTSIQSEKEIKNEISNRKKTSSIKKEKNLKEITRKFENVTNLTNNDIKSADLINDCSPAVNRKKRKLALSNDEDDEKNKKIKRESIDAEEKEKKFKRLVKMRNLEKNVCPICLSLNFFGHLNF